MSVCLDVSPHLLLHNQKEHAIQILHLDSIADLQLIFIIFETEGVAYRGWEAEPPFH